MRMLLATDIHGAADVLAAMMAEAGPVDAALLGGDLTDFGTPGDAEKVVRAAAAAPRVFAVAGNCDSREIDRRLESLGVGLNGLGTTYAGVRFQGLSAMPPWIHRMYHYTEDELAELLQRGLRQCGDRGPHVVLSHCPPRGLLDRTWLGSHAGSTALRTFLEQQHPTLVVCGHIHEGRGVEPFGATTVVNCGRGGDGYYAIAQWTGALTVELRELGVKPPAT